MMSDPSNSSMTKLVERAVEAHRNELLLKAHNEAWARDMIEDPEAIAELEAERELWDRTVADGMKPT